MCIQTIFCFAGSLLVAGLVGCSPGPMTANPDAAANPAAPAAVRGNTELQGKISIDGSSTVFPIAEAAASQFQKLFPSVSVNVGVSGTGGGFKRFVKGEIDVSNASRPIAADEVEAAKASQVSFVELPIAYDGLTIVVHASNDWVDNLTVEEVKKIYASEGAAKTWSEVRSGWPDKPLKPFSPGTDSGTFDYFREVVVGKTGSLRSDMSTSEDDNVLVTGVAGSPDAIAFFGVAYYEENKDKVKVVPVVNPETKVAVLPSSESIESGDYAPFSRPLFLYVNAKAIGRPEVNQYVSFFLENAGDLAKKGNAVALPESVIATATQVFKGRKTGTHYLTAEGEKRSGPVTDVYQPSNLTESK